MSRDEFLQRVRAAAAQGRAWRPATRPVPPGAGYVGAGPDLAASMAAEVTAVGGVAYRVDGPEAAHNTLARLLRKFEPQRALVWDHPLLERIELRALLAKLGVEAIDHAALAARSAAERREVAFAADVGITSADWGIAETGSLVLRARPGQERIASLLPPVHVAIVERAQLLPDLFDLFAKLADEGLESLTSHVTLVTGPSKTGDIELQLTTGVHGPGQWHVIVIG